MAQLSHTWEVRDPYPTQASDREPAITLPSLQMLPGVLDPTPKASAAQSCPTLCDPMDCSMPGFPVHHQLPEPTLMPPLNLCAHPRHHPPSRLMPSLHGPPNKTLIAEGATTVFSAIEHSLEPSPNSTPLLPPQGQEREAAAWGGGLAVGPGAPAPVYIIYNIYIYIYI